MGLTCMSCGLVVVETKTFVNQEHRGKEGPLTTHEILHGNVTTLVGTPHKRMMSRLDNLGLVQRSGMTYPEFKRSRVYHLIKGAIYALELPELLKDHAMYIFCKIVKHVQKKTSLAGSRMLAALSLYVAAKNLQVTIDREPLLSVLNVQKSSFNIQLLRLNKTEFSSISVGNSKVMGNETLNLVLSVIRGIAGEGNYLPIIKDVYSAVSGELVSIREHTKTAVIAFIALNIASPAKASLTSVANTLHYRVASLHKAIKRLFRRLGFNDRIRLSQPGIQIYIRKIMTGFEENNRMRSPPITG